MAAVLRILGCGEAFDSGSGNNSCLLYEGRDGAPVRHVLKAKSRPRVPTLLFDCGYQIPERLWLLPRVYPQLDGVFLTHLHADHSFGLVPVLTRFWEEKRTRELRIVGPKGTRAFVTRLLDLGYPGMRKRLTFNLNYQEVSQADSLQWGPLSFRFARSQHSVLNLAIRVDQMGSRKTRTGAHPGISFALSGDGQLTPATRALYQGVRVVLHETYSRDPLVSTHADLKTLSKFAAESAMERIGITHISRHEKSKVEAMLKQLQRQEPGRWFRLQPGMEIPLGDS